MYHEFSKFHTYIQKVHLGIVNVVIYSANFQYVFMPMEIEY